jgi:tetratricopeptide (TPR) repeat protein
MEGVSQGVFTLRGAYRLTDGARVFWQQMTPPPTLVAHSLTEKILPQLEAVTPLNMVLRLIHGGWLAYLSPDLAQALMRACARWIPLSGAWGLWGAAIAASRRYLPDTPYWRCWQTLEEARLLRWEGRLADQQRMLGDLIQRAGSLGYFDLYAQALLEWGLSAILRDQKAEAAETAEKAAALFQRHGDTLNMERARLVQARALLEIAPQQTLDLVQSLGSQVAGAAALAGEANLQLDHPAAAVRWATQAVELTAPGSINRGRAVHLLALALAAAGETLIALDYQQQAINLLIHTPDLLGMVRAYHNLGVLYWRLGDQDQAHKIWQQGLASALQIQDGAVLQSLRRNLRDPDAPLPLSAS